jgi:hypothetical protein
LTKGKRFERVKNDFLRTLKCGGHASLCFVFRLRQRLETFLWKRGFCAHRYLCLCVASGNFGCVSVHSKIGNHKRVAFDITHTHTQVFKKPSAKQQQPCWLLVERCLRVLGSFSWRYFPTHFSLIFNSKSTRAYTTRERQKCGGNDSQL